ncbi:hypothetical protein BDQ12DRAFT_585115, partial [Crucibulum laeve]
FKGRSCTVLVMRVPITFSPQDESHVTEVLEANNIPRTHWIKSRWAKAPACHSGTQNTAHLMIHLSDINTANEIILHDMTIFNLHHPAVKNKKEPIKCAKCQGRDHITAKCISKEDVCRICGMQHHMSECPNTATGPKRCVSCDISDHSSQDHDCPTFLRKCKEYSKQHPENSLPSYPAVEPWTWSPQPPTE